jgi:hypothetical protein
VQVGQSDGREQRPVAVLHHPLHEQVRNPVGGVHVVRAAAVVAGVLAQLEELLDVEVPGLEVGADRALALAALVDRHRGVVDHLQERHHALALAVGALDVAAQRAHRRPVVAQAAGELGQQRVFLDRLVDAVQVVGHGGQVAARQLRAPRAGVEQRRRRAHEVEARQHVVELDRARLAVDLVQRQAHRHAHEEGLRQLDAAAVDVQEVAVVQRLQAEVVELQVALGLERRAQALPVEDIVPCHLVLPRAHQGQLHLILDVLDMDRAAPGQPAGEGGGDLLRELRHALVDAAGGGGIAAFHGQEGLGHGDHDLVGVKVGNLAVAPDDLDPARGVGGDLGTGPGGDRGGALARNGAFEDGFLGRGGCGHGSSSSGLWGDWLPCGAREPRGGSSAGS